MPPVRLPPLQRALQQPGKWPWTSPPELALVFPSSIVGPLNWRTSARGSLLVHGAGAVSPCSQQVCVFQTAPTKFKCPSKNGIDKNTRSGARSRFLPLHTYEKRLN